MADFLTLNDVCELIVDTKHKTPKFVESGYPCIRTPNIGKGFLILDNAKHVSEESYIEWTERATPAEDELIFAREAPVGNVIIIPKGLKVCHGQRTVLIRANKSKINPHYLMYLMLSEELQGLIHSMASGATVAHLNMSDIRSLKLPKLPLINEQKKIAEYLKNYDNLIENNNRRIAILEDMAQSLYREWFVNFRYPGYANNVDASLDEKLNNQKFIDSPLGKIPEGWEVKRLDEVADVNPESITKKNAPESIGYIDIRSVGSGVINEVKPMQFKDAPSRARRIVIDGDIIWATVRPNRKQFSYICKPSTNTIASTGFAVLRSKNVPSSYLYSFTTTDSFTSYLVNHATGSAYPAVNTDIFKKATVLVPPCDLLEKFDELCSSAMQQSEVLKKKNENLKKQRDMLLPKLISGQIQL